MNSDGIIEVLFGRTQTTDADTFGIVIFEAADNVSAEQVMLADAALAEGCITACLQPFLVAGMRS